MQRSRSLHGTLDVHYLRKAKAVEKSFDLGGGGGEGQGNEDHNDMLAMTAQIMMFFS